MNTIANSLLARACALVFAFLAAFGSSAQVPEFELDRDWPELPLGNKWLTGGLGGMCIDQQDHLYLLNRQNVVEADLDGARLAPPIIELNPEGKVVRGWGDPARLGGRLHDCHVDSAQNIWVVAAATGYIQKWSHEGTRKLMQIGESAVFDSSDGTRRGLPLNSDNAQFFLPAAIDIDGTTGNIYVADGELPGGNSRIAVVDRTGKFLHQWRLARNPSEGDIIELPHCLRISHDGLVYVCDRRADRIQVFTLAGELVDIFDASFTAITDPAGRDSGDRGSAVVLAFSHDVEQKYLYVVNQNSVRVDILDRSSGEKLGSFGEGPGRYPGQFELPHAIAVDSLGNVYVAEQEGRRVQRFIDKRDSAGRLSN